MRYLNKPINCNRLKKKRKNPPSDELKAKRAWRRFNKKDTRKACYKLQQGLCAYTELSLDSALGNHLEHIAPRSLHPERTFSANNIILSILSDEFAGTLEPSLRFGGHHKKSHYADEWFISPFHGDCDGYFEYCAQSGEVLPTKQLPHASRKKARQTIDVLNLNATYLVTRRLEVLSPLQQILHVLSDHQQASNADLINAPSPNPPLSLKQLVQQHLLPKNGCLPEFYSARKQLFAKYFPKLSPG